MASKTIANIQDLFQTMLRTSKTLGASNEQEKEIARIFYKSSMETFAQWATQMQAASTYLQDEQSKFFEYLSLQGQRLGEMNNHMKSMQHDYSQREVKLHEKQQKLFNFTGLWPDRQTIAGIKLKVVL